MLYNGVTALKVHLSVEAATSRKKHNPNARGKESSIALSQREIKGSMNSFRCHRHLLIFVHKLHITKTSLVLQLKYQKILEIREILLLLLFFIILCRILSILNITCKSILKITCFKIRLVNTNYDFFV